MKMSSENRELKMELYFAESIFSPIYPCKFRYEVRDQNKKRIEKREFNCIEQAYQYMRFFKPSQSKLNGEALELMLSKILDATDGMKLKNDCDKSQRHSYGKTVYQKEVAGRSDWELPSPEGNILLKYHFLFEIMCARFQNDHEAIQRLGETGQCDITVIGDDEWLCTGKKGTGYNLYGKFLMAIRKDFC